MLTKGRRLSGLYNSEEIVSYILTYGGPFGSVEERLRYIFATMICNSPHIENDNNGSRANENNNNENNDESCYKDDYFDDYEQEKDALFEWISEYNPNNEVNKNKNNTGEDDDDDDRRDDDNTTSEQRQQIMSYQHPEGKGNGIVHNHALRVLANALGNVSSSMQDYPVVDDDDEEQEQHRRPQIPLDGTIWKNIIRCIVDNIENTETRRSKNINGTGYSLKILRLLYEIQPQMILPLLRHTLFTSLVYLIEYGNVHQFPMIYKEASYLLAAATAMPS
ncbi:hypothetical protein FRACYDRAFT_246251 [Fragilariopsis cylindrus CCMP1102]|uniref:Uncharacterized protein n=1 Tax=Fragilariopsis cylindrus CCMP1102 TaxID=635003 RepID=A0A1E7EYP5_9STRA|nr:hypothetical protein FRACYDRAFT_246251 [Fragilariopsis cylindrus CCMP1102]|eukprot:OEU11140.1 hypothetical protein FRACYDRAFT_246251 [Fragilariopsis cylindrus CCMP1102]